MFSFSWTRAAAFSLRFVVFQLHDSNISHKFTPFCWPRMKSKSHRISCFQFESIRFITLHFLSLFICLMCTVVMYNEMKWGAQSIARKNYQTKCEFRCEITHATLFYLNNNFDNIFNITILSRQFIPMQNAKESANFGFNWRKFCRQVQRSLRDLNLTDIIFSVGGKDSLLTVNDSKHKLPVKWLFSTG